MKKLDTSPTAQFFNRPSKMDMINKINELVDKINELEKKGCKHKDLRMQYTTELVDGTYTVLKCQTCEKKIAVPLT